MSRPAPVPVAAEEEASPDTLGRSPSILIVSALFTPSRLIGARRPERMARELKARGWDVTVLTLQEQFMTPIDPGMVDPPCVEVIRTPMVRPVERLRRIASRLRRLGRTESAHRPVEGEHPSPSRLPRLKVTAEAWASHVEFPDAWTFWRPFAARAAYHRRFDVVLATLPPFTPALIARRLARRNDARLVLDYRDPWLESPSRAALQQIGSGRLYRRLKALEDECLDECALAIGTTPSICRILEHRGSRRVAFVPNSFDVPASIEHAAGSGGILYLGSLTAGRRLEPLIAALRRLDVDPASKGLRLTYAGPDGKLALEQAAAAGGSDRVELLGDVPRQQAMRLLDAAHLAVVIVSRGFEHAIPGKIYEILAQRRPILLIGDSASDASAMVREYGLGFAHAPDDIEGIARSVGAALRGERPVPRNLSDFSTLHVADRLDRELRAHVRP